MPTNSPDPGASVFSDTSILIPRHVSDLDAFVASPGAHLVSIHDEPARAADLWRERYARHKYGSDGVVELRYRGVELLGPRFWDDVDGIWRELVEVVGGYVHGGAGEGGLHGQPVTIRLVRAHRSTTFEVNGVRSWVEPAELVAGVLREARRYFEWTTEWIGSGEQGVLERIDDLTGAERRGSVTDVANQKD